MALPILAPSLLGSFLLLFANAFGAYATAWTLTGPDVNLVTVQIAALVRGEVQLDPALADALALVSLGVMAACVVGYRWLATRPLEGDAMKGRAAWRVLMLGLFLVFMLVPSWRPCSSPCPSAGTGRSGRRDSRSGGGRPSPPAPRFRTHC